MKSRGNMLGQPLPGQVMNPTGMFNLEHFVSAISHLIGSPIRIQTLHLNITDRQMNLPGGPHSPMNMQQMVRQNTMQGNQLLRQNTLMMQQMGPNGMMASPNMMSPMDYQNMTEEERKTIPPDKLKSILRKIILIGRLADTVSQQLSHKI